jgi:hypothetical protein
MRLASFALVAAVVLASCTKLDAPSNDSASSKPAAAVEGAKAAFVVAQLDPSAGDVRAALAAEAKKAKEKGLRPFVELWATWCAPCVALKKSMGHPRIDAAFQGTYVVQLDIDAWGAKLDGVGLSSSVIPIFYALDDEGRPTGRKIDGGAWGDDVPENMGPVLDKFFHGT